MLTALPSLAVSAGLVSVFVPSLSPSVLEISNGSRPGLPSAVTAFWFVSKPVEMTPGVCFFLPLLPRHSSTCSRFHSLFMAAPMGQRWTPLKVRVHWYLCFFIHKTYYYSIKKKLEWFEVIQFRQISVGCYPPPIALSFLGVLLEAGWALTPQLLLYLSQKPELSALLCAESWILLYPPQSWEWHLILWWFTWRYPQEGWLPQKLETDEKNHFK